MVPSFSALDADGLQRTELTGLRTAALRMSRGFLRNIRGEKHPARTAVIADLIQFARRQSRIGDDRPRIDPARRQQQRRKRDAVFADDDHPVARPDAERLETSGDICDRTDPVRDSSRRHRPRSARCGREIRQHAGQSPDACGAEAQRQSRRYRSLPTLSPPLTSRHPSSRLFARPYRLSQLTFFFRTRQSISANIRFPTWSGTMTYSCGTSSCAETAVYNRARTPILY